MRGRRLWIVTIVMIVAIGLFPSASKSCVASVGFGERFSLYQFDGREFDNDKLPDAVSHVIGILR